MKLTPIQWIGATLVILGALVGSTTQLATLFGDHVTQIIVASSTVLSSILGGLVMFFGGQNSQINAVRSMPGVQSIVVNEKATGMLASLAVARDDNKVEATPQAQKAVEATAKAEK
jgi:hypothetical protein